MTMYVPRKPNKYNAKRTKMDGVTFDSQKEALRWRDLVLLEKGKQISDLQRQVAVSLIGQHGHLLTATGLPMKLTFDFCYCENGVLIFEDVKGVKTRDYAVRVAVVKAMGLAVKET